MSGGSYNYLYTAQDDAEDLAAKRYRMVEMADRLDGLAPDSNAACDTREVLAIIAALEVAGNRRLAAVWHAVEWYDSNDWSEQQMLDVIAEYEANRVVELADETS